MAEEQYETHDEANAYIWEYYAEDYYFDYYEQDAADAITIYIYPIILFIGTIGNIFSLIIMYRLSHKVLSTCIYLSVLAIVDLLVLYTRCGNDWLLKVSHVDLSHTLMISSDSVCKVYPFFFNFLFHTSKWLLVCTATEGMISTCYPERMYTMCTISRAKVIIMLLTVILICINIHYFWSFDLILFKEYGNAWFCTFAKHGHQQSEEFQEIIWPLMDLSIAQVIPIFTLTIYTCIMIRWICKGNHRGDIKHQRWRERYQLYPEAMDHLKVTITGVSIMFLALNLPKFVFTIFQYFVNKYELVELSMKFTVQMDLARTVCDMLENCFLCAKFIVYFLSCQMFRQECKDIISLLLCSRKRKIYVNNNSKSVNPRSTSPMRNPYSRCETSNHTQSNSILRTYTNVTVV